MVDEIRDDLFRSIDLEVSLYKGSLKGESGFTPEWEDGFIQGILQVRNYIIDPVMDYWLEEEY